MARGTDVPTIRVTVLGGPERGVFDAPRPHPGARVQVRASVRAAVDDTRSAIARRGFPVTDLAVLDGTRTLFLVDGVGYPTGTLDGPAIVDHGHLLRERLVQSDCIYLTVEASAPHQLAGLAQMLGVAVDERVGSGLPCPSVVVLVRGRATSSVRVVEQVRAAFADGVAARIREHEVADIVPALVFSAVEFLAAAEVAERRFLRAVTIERPTDDGDIAVLARRFGPTWRFRRHRAGLTALQKQLVEAAERRHASVAALRAELERLPIADATCVDGASGRV